MPTSPRPHSGKNHSKHTGNLSTTQCHPAHDNLRATTCSFVPHIQYNSHTEPHQRSTHPITIHAPLLPHTTLQTGHTIHPHTTPHPLPYNEPFNHTCPTRTPKPPKKDVSNIKPTLSHHRSSPPTPHPTTTSQTTPHSTNYRTGYDAPPLLHNTLSQHHCKRTSTQPNIHKKTTAPNQEHSFPQVPHTTTQTTKRRPQHNTNMEPPALPPPSHTLHTIAYHTTPNQNRTRYDAPSLPHNTSNTTPLKANQHIPTYTQLMSTLSNHEHP